MRFKPSALERFLATLPDNLSLLAHEAIAEEFARWDRGDLTDEELELREQARALGRSARETWEKHVKSILEQE